MHNKLEICALHTQEEVISKGLQVKALSTGVSSLSYCCSNNYTLLQRQNSQQVRRNLIKLIPVKEPLNTAVHSDIQASDRIR